MEYFYQVEDRDGVRFSWNLWPSSRLEAARMVVPLGCMYTPLKKGNVPMVFYDPVQCKRCHSILNPYCTIDLNSKVWVCPFCYNHNQFPPAYNAITANNLPIELQATSMEYVLHRQTPGLPPAFIFVIDVCLDRDELQALKDAVLMAITSLPEKACIGLITFGPLVQVYELAFGYCPKSYVFQGTEDVTPKDVQKFLGLGQPGSGGEVQASSKNSFIMPLHQVEFNLTSILEELQKDPRAVRAEKRPLRSTGVAISVALSMLEYTFPNSGARVICFMGGPCTQGPGTVIGEELKETIRSHHDLNKELAKHVHKATKFYTQLAEKAVAKGHSVDLASCALDQTGLLEMRQLAKMTGGVVLMSESFEHHRFQKGFQKIFEKDDKGHLQMAFNASIEVVTSRELKVCGCIGHVASLNRRGTSVAETEIGIGNTSAWKMCLLDDKSTFAFYFEIVNQHSNKIEPGKKGMVQFLTQYQHPGGQKVLRISTVAYNWADTSTGPKSLLPGFDYEAAAAIIARIGVFRAEAEETNVIRWLDRQLIRFISRFANYRKDDVSTLVLSSELEVYSQLMFHLRRGPLVQSFNFSPDETVFHRYYLNRENTANTLIMIQPTLDSYTFDVEEPVPVLLSVRSIEPDKILLLDTFFHVLVYHGETVAMWRNEGYHQNPEYENFKTLLEIPQEDAKEMIDNRFPRPMFIDCDQGGSQERFLLAFLDPEITHKSGGIGDGKKVIFTEDVSLQVFIDHLKKRAVETES